MPEEDAQPHSVIACLVTNGLLRASGEETEAQLGLLLHYWLDGRVAIGSGPGELPLAAARATWAKSVAGILQARDALIERMETEAAAMT